MKKLDVVAIGENSLDTIWRLSSWPLPGAKLRAEGTPLEGPGGQVATLALALARWGHKVGYVGAVGDDRAGVEALRLLEAAGLDLCVQRVAEVSSRRAVIFSEGDGERTIIEYRDPALRVCPAGVPVEWLSSCRALHLDGTQRELMRPCIELARASGALTSADLDGVSSLPAGTLALIDLLVVSQSVVTELGAKSEADALELLCAECPGLVVITRGAAGCVARVAGEMVEVPAHSVKALDTTGCGDLFRAGLLHGLLSGLAAVESLRLASAAGALQATAYGAQAAIPSLTRVEREASLVRRGKVVLTTEHGKSNSTL